MGSPATAVKPALRRHLKLCTKFDPEPTESGSSSPSPSPPSLPLPSSPSSLPLPVSSPFLLPFRLRGSVVENAKRLLNASRTLHVPQQSDVEVVEEEPRPKVTTWLSSSVNCWLRSGTRSRVPALLRQDRRRGGVRQWRPTTAKAPRSRALWRRGNAWLQRSRSFVGSWGQTTSRLRSGASSWRAFDNSAHCTRESWMDNVASRKPPRRLCSDGRRWPTAQEEELRAKQGQAELLRSFRGVDPPPEEAGPSLSSVREAAGSLVRHGLGG